MTEISDDQRSRLVQELIDFDTTDLDAPVSRRQWGLSSSWKWDEKDKPKGQEFSIPEKFTGKEDKCYNPDDFTGAKYHSYDHENYVQMKSDSRFSPEEKSLLRKGESGKVYRVRCNGRVLARKKTSLRLEWLETMDEIKALKKVNHNHVAQLVGIYVVGYDVYTLSYPVADMTLRKFMEPGLIGTPTWANTLIGGLGCLSNALAYLHSAGIKHRDIHDKNILVLGGYLILCDFGWSDVSKSRKSILESKSSALGCPRLEDVRCLGDVFHQILCMMFGSHASLPTTFRTMNFKNSMSPVPKHLDQNDLLGLVAVMTADEESERATASSVAEYLRLGSTDVFQRLSTCGNCCR